MSFGVESFLRQEAYIKCGTIEVSEMMAIR